MNRHLLRAAVATFVLSGSLLFAAVHRESAARRLHERR